MQPRLSLLTLGVADLKKSCAFYVDGLGWKPSSASNDDVIFIQLNGFALGLWSHEALAQDAAVPANRSGFRGFSLAYNTRSREEVDEVMAAAVKAGAKITNPAHETFWGGYAGYFEDPDGFLWEVAHNAAFKLTAEGDCILP
jgi:catechol 2,3-dioxygenase-like lactoylglutathione lyase family enzyme